MAFDHLIGHDYNKECRIRAANYLETAITLEKMDRPKEIVDDLLDEAVFWEDQSTISSIIDHIPYKGCKWRLHEDWSGKTYNEEEL